MKGELPRSDRSVHRLPVRLATAMRWIAAVFFAALLGAIYFLLQNRICLPQFWTCTLLAFLCAGMLAVALVWRHSLEETLNRGREAESERDMLAVRLDYLSRHMNDALIVLDENHAVIDSNQRAIQMYGWNREELIGMPARNLRAPETAVGQEQDLRAPAGTLISTLHRRKDGTVFPVEVSISRFEVHGRAFVAGIIRDVSERVKTEEALRMSETSFRSLFDNMHEGVALHKLVRDQAGLVVNYQVIEVNRRYLEILGFERGKVVNHLSTEIYKTAEPPFLDVFAKTGLTSIPTDFEVHYPPLNRHIHVSVAPWGTDGFATIFTDITAKKRIETALLESERRFRGAMETARSVALQLDRDGRVTFANEALLRLLGCPLNEVVGADWYGKFVPSGDREVNRGMFRTVLESAQAPESIVIPNPNDSRVITGSGDIRTIRWSSSLITHSDGTVMGISRFGEDITERQQSLEALRESEERFRRIFDESSVGIVIVGVDGRFVRANRAFREFIGFSEEELTRMTFSDITHPEHREQDQIEVGRVLAGDIPRYVTDKRYLRKDGSLAWGRVTVSLMRGGKGVPKYFLSMIDDTTGLHQAGE